MVPASEIELGVDPIVTFPVMVHIHVPAGSDTDPLLALIVCVTVSNAAPAGNTNSVVNTMIRLL